MQFQFAGQAGVSYVMEVSTNLVPPIVWQSMQTNLGTGGLMQMADPISSDGVRFYRVRAEQGTWQQNGLLPRGAGPSIH